MLIMWSYIIQTTQQKRNSCCRPKKANSI